MNPLQAFRTCLLIVSCGLFLPDAAQAAQWERTYSGGGDDRAYSLQPTPDGGYVFAGSTSSSGAGGVDAWVVKLDPAGNITWQKSFGGASEDIAYSVQSASDGGYIVAGFTSSFGAGARDAWVLKLDAAGNLVWQKTYGGSGDDIAWSVRAMPDGTYIVAAATYLGAGVDDFWVLKLDGNGNVIWQQTYGSTGGDSASSIQPTNDGGYIVAGHTFSFGAGNADFWVLRLNATGGVVWQKTYGGSKGDIALSVQPTADGGFVVAGQTFSFGAGGSDAWVLKLDGGGSAIWQKTFGGTHDDGAYAALPTVDGGYVVAGYTTSAGGSVDAWIFKLDGSANVVWSKTFGGSGAAFAHSVQTTADDGFAIGGFASFGGALALKLDADGAIPGCSNMKAVSPFSSSTNAVAGMSSATIIPASAMPVVSSITSRNSTATQTAQCFFAPQAPVVATQVRTLSEWGVIALAMLLATVGIASIRRQA